MNIAFLEGWCELAFPSLTNAGICPEGTHDCTLDEIAANLCHNEARQRLWDKFLEFHAWMLTQPVPPSILIDGSFSTDKTVPGDIDVVVDLTGADDATIGFWATQYFNRKQQIGQIYNLDFYIYFPGAPKDLRAFFTYVKVEEAIARGLQPEDRKGLLRVTL